MDTSAVIEIKNVSKKFKGFELSIDNLEIPEGFSTALIGENGAGKSTLLNILAGIRKDYNGEVSFFNQRFEGKDIRENIGYEGTDDFFLPHWTVKDIETVSKMLFESFNSDRYNMLCDELNITETEKSFSKLSDGMKMKTILSAVFARDTSLLLLDEPASPLDPLMRDKLCSMIRDYIDEGNGQKSVLFSTHNISDMENVTDYAVIIEQGKVVEQGFVEDLKEKYVMVKGETADESGKELVTNTLCGAAFSRYGFEGLCPAEDLDKLAGLDIAVETATLSQICVGVMKKYTLIH
ncbi:MAG: ABC transporter ATP-binding protein [Lachnospiraceae bacterium]|nr:ABC transporter ATP-binding protein [Lachnospiraceae bacterium]